MTSDAQDQRRKAKRETAEDAPRSVAAAPERPRRGRPSLAALEARSAQQKPLGRSSGPTHTLAHVRLTERQAKALDAMQDAQGFRTRSELMRHLIASGVGLPSATPQELAQLAALRVALGLIGRNLNQAIRAMHERGAEAPDIEALRDQIKPIREALGRYTGFDKT